MLTLVFRLPGQPSRLTCEHQTSRMQRWDEEGHLRPQREPAVVDEAAAARRLVGLLELEPSVAPRVGRRRRLRLLVIFDGVPFWPTSFAVVSSRPSAAAAAEQPASVVIEPAPLASQLLPDSIIVKY